MNSPRPGHADLAGAEIQLFGSALCAGACLGSGICGARRRGRPAKLFLREIGIEVFSHVISVGSAAVDKEISWDQIKPLASKTEFC